MRVIQMQGIFFFAILCFRPTEWVCYLAYLHIFLVFLNFLLLQVL